MRKLRIKKKKKTEKLSGNIAQITQIASGTSPINEYNTSSPPPHDSRIDNYEPAIMYLIN